MADILVNKEFFRFVNIQFLLLPHHLQLKLTNEFLFQFINIVVNLLDALKTSFSHRSLAARSIGKKDSVSDATVAGLLMAKSYIKTYRNGEDKCMQKYVCEANSECIQDVGGASIFCQLGSYATSFFLERTTDSSFQSFYEAGRRGRSGVDCRQVYLECNEV